MSLDGERVTRRMYPMGLNPSFKKPTVDLLPNTLQDQCSDYALNVLADDSGIESQNDVSNVFFIFDQTVSGATLKLKQWLNGAWTIVATISNQNYGVYIAYGTIINSAKQKLVSIEIDWSVVLAAFGEGTYKITCSYVDPINGNDDLDSAEYSLLTYSPTHADNTVRLEYSLSGVIGDNENDELVRDFGTATVYNTLRLKGVFGYPESEYQEEDTELNNGKSEFVEDYQTPTYNLSLLFLPFFVHELLRTDFMMSDSMAITDYNSRNNAFYVKKYLRKKSGYKPNWYQLQSNLASVDLQFTQQFNRYRKFRN